MRFYRGRASGRGSMLPYLRSEAKMDMETNFVDSRGVVVAGSNNSMHIYEAYHLPLDVIRETIRMVPFLCESDFVTYMLKESYDLV